jgi:predicted MFS family arabinose efflux permease
MPLLGWLIARTDRWYSPFPVLAAAGFLSLGLLWRSIPSDAVQIEHRPSLLEGLKTVAAYAPALAALVMGFMLTLSNETVGIMYGAWLEDAFRLKVTALGASAIVIGVAELTGEGTVAGFVDRIGKRRAVAVGLGLNAATCLLLPVLGFNVAGAMVGLFLFYLTFEFTLVSSIPLMTELIPTARATLLATNVTAYAGGRMVGSLIGPHLYDWGWYANGIAAAIFVLVALAVLLRFIRQE